MIVLRGVTLSGDVVFYTGKAGDGWVSADISEAFPYSLLGARAKARVFNQREVLTGIRFIAYDTDRGDE